MRDMVCQPIEELVAGIEGKWRVVLPDLALHPLPKVGVYYWAGRRRCACKGLLGAQGG